MSLSFLQKKSWHTMKTSNQEQVWIQEEAKKKEDAKLEEYKKQIKEEREQEEMLRITGRGDEAAHASLNWMYSGGQKSAAEQEEEAESFLLGKKFEANGGKTEVAEMEEARDAGAAVAKEKNMVGTLFMGKATSEAYEEFSRNLEDPLTLMRKREEMMRAKMGQDVRVKEVLQQPERERNASKKEKKEKKEKKKAKKADKKMKKKEKKEKKRRRKDSSSGSSSDSEEEERPAKKEKKDSSPAKKEAPVSEAPFVKKAGYGLQSKGGAPAPPSSGRLGPDPELLRAKSETEEAAKRKTAELLARKRGSESSAPTERAARLREMQEDAGRVDRERAKKVSDKAKENDDEEEEVGGSKASFLADMARNTHGVGDQEQSLGDRISRNKQNSQRGDANMF